MTPEDKVKQYRAFQAMQCAAVNELLTGLEQIADSQSVAAVYLVRAAKIMVALRHTQQSTPEEVAEMARCFVDLALDDENLNEAVDPAGNAAPGSERVH